MEYMGSYYNILKAIVYLLKGDYKGLGLRCYGLGLALESSV